MGSMPIRPSNENEFPNDEQIVVLNAKKLSYDLEWTFKWIYTSLPVRSTNTSTDLVNLENTQKMVDVEQIDYHHHELQVTK